MDLSSSVSFLQFQLRPGQYPHLRIWNKLLFFFFFITFAFKKISDISEISDHSSNISDLKHRSKRCPWMFVLGIAFLVTLQIKYGSNQRHTLRSWRFLLIFFGFLSLSDLGNITNPHGRPSKLQSQIFVHSVCLASSVNLVYSYVTCGPC